MNKDKLKIIGLNGSLRKKSYNGAALRFAQKNMPDNSELEILDLSKLPFFNEDVEAEGIPSVVSEFIDKLLQADGFLISTPEYNYSIPPVLKNAIDWASRDERMPFKDKWVALMSASMGGLGGARAQYHLRQVGIYPEMRFLNKPEVFIGSAHTKFDDAGNLVDEFTQKSIIKLVNTLIDNINKQ